MSVAPASERARRALALPEHLSYSSMTLFADCPRRFEARKILEIPELPSTPRDVGSLVHGMIAAYLLALAKGEDGSIAAYDAMVTSGQQQHFAAATMLFERWTTRFDVPIERVFAIEDLYTRRAPGVPVPIVAYPDLVYVDVDDATLVVRDVKTGWSAEVTPGYEFQIQLYLYCARGSWPDRSVIGELDFARSGIVKRIEYVGDDAVELRVLALWRSLHEAYAEDRFVAAPGGHCGYCPVAVSCAESVVLAGEGMVVTNHEEAGAALELVTRLEAGVASLKSALKAFVAQEGPIATPRASASFRASESLGIKDAAAFVYRVGIDEAQPYLTVDDRKATRLASDPRVSDLFGVTSRSNRFIIGGAPTE